MTSPSLLFAPTTTPLSSLTPTHARLTASYLSGKTRPLEYRRIQLRKLFHVFHDCLPHIHAALRQDLNKNPIESFMTESSWVEKDIMYTLENLERWAAEDSIDVDLMYRLMRPRIRKDPIGTVLVIGPFNYPVQLVLVPLIGAIAAGCTALIKPSEMAPYSAAVVQHIVETALDPDCYAVVNGSVEETTKLLELKWDKILYTGNGAVGRIVSAAAAKHLTPVILELGGLNPVFITSKADAKLAARRIAWGKVHNCGQICLSPDYVLLDPSVETAFVEGYITTMNKFLPNGTHDPDNISRIVNERHFKRITGLLENTKGTVVFGGGSELSDKWIEPTLVKVDTLEDSLLSEEIFGPVLPYLVVKGGLQEMVGIVRKIGDCPLGLYAFTSDKKEQEFILSSTRSGGVTFNDVMFHAAIQTIPFGGVGESGTGCYRGKDSFDAFIHKRPILNQPNWLEGQLGMRYPPYTKATLRKFSRTRNIGAPNFDKNGKLLYGGAFWRAVLLGASAPKRALLRYILAFLGAYLIRRVATLGR